MDNTEILKDIGPEPVVDEDEAGQVFDLLDDAGYVDEGDAVGQIRETLNVIESVREHGEVSQSDVSAMEQIGLSIANESFPLKGFTASRSRVGADHVIASLEADGVTAAAKALFTATGKFAKTVGGALVKASHVVSDILDNTHGQKPAIDFSIRRLSAMHDEVKDAVEERGGWPDGAADILKTPSDEMDVEFIRMNIDKGLGAFVKRKAAASLLFALNGKRPAFEIEIITRPEVVQRGIETAGKELASLTKSINDNASFDAISKNPGRIKAIPETAVNALRDLKGMLKASDDYKVGEPEDYQNFTRVAETINGAMKSIASADLDGRTFKEMKSRIETMNKDVEKAVNGGDELTPDSMEAWKRLTKNISVATELYQTLVKCAIHVEDVTDIFDRVLINARREMVVVLEIAAEQADPMVAKRLMLIAEREKESIIEGQDKMRAARRKAAERRNTVEA